jgi:type I restriction enzyme M protein
LFAYLRDLRGRNGGRDRRDVIATAFKGLSNRMESGYLLRDVVNLVDDIHFNSSEEIHTLSRLYEGLLREMRDAAGDSGEFYTPRSVVRLMVQLTDPKLGEVVMDPACGTGGFLAEAFSHLERQANTVEKRKVLQAQSIRGGEAKSLPYLLAQMNLLLHGLEAPDVDPGNSLRFRLSEMGDKDRVDVILTNPPFGGEEETGILTNFPEDRRATETSLLFMQLIMRRLKRGGKGRAAVVVPNGFLFGDGIAARIKADILAQFNLHTIIRLPEGVFAPYTQIPTNILFFDTSGPTEEIWFWEHQVSEGRKKYSKTQPLQDDELAGCITWWKKRKKGPQAWRVKAADLIKRDEKGQVVDVNLDIKNPATKEAIDHRSPREILESIVAKEQQVLTLLAEMRKLVTQGVAG